MNFYWYKQKGQWHSEKSVLNKWLNNIQTFSYRQRRLDCYVGPKHLRFLWYKHSLGICSLLVRPLLLAVNTWVSIVYRTFLFMIDPKDKFWYPLNVRISIFLFSNIQRKFNFPPHIRVIYMLMRWDKFDATKMQFGLHLPQLTHESKICCCTFSSKAPYRIYLCT